MKPVVFFLGLSMVITACTGTTKPVANKNEKPDTVSSDFTIAFGSCNKQYETNLLWDDVLEQNPDIWVWGGDIVYSDTDDMQKMAADYAQQLDQHGYDSLLKSVPVHGTWDDHDYGLNDGGKDFEKREESQQKLLDFLGVPKNHERRYKPGVYYDQLFETPKGSVQLLVLDTRYFRTALRKANAPGRRYDPTTDPNSTMLGEAQWKWLTEKLQTSKADFNVIVSSIQFLSQEHGFEGWGTMPSEVQKMYDLIRDSEAKGVVFLSGDRHISEFSRTTISGVSYPIVDFTSSGMTHSYESFSGEVNKHRIGEVVSQKSFGLLRFNFEAQEIEMQMLGDAKHVYQELKQRY